MELIELTTKCEECGKEFTYKVNKATAHKSRRKLCDECKEKHKKLYNQNYKETRKAVGKKQRRANRRLIEPPASLFYNGELGTKSLAEVDKKCTEYLRKKLPKHTFSIIPNIDIEPQRSINYGDNAAARYMALSQRQKGVSSEVNSI